ncbi:MAG: hypothetical protein IPL27_25300 [Lewinellaceae bacterium]|nr:hypothetical protein [Lewinellaceae bacterium]
MSQINHGELFTRKRSRMEQLRDWLGERLLLQKLNNPLGMALLLLATLPVSYALATLDIKLSLIVFLALIGFPMVVWCLFNLTFAIGLMLLIALMVPFGAKFTTAPIGTLLDLLILICVVGILLRQIKERDWSLPNFR